MLTFEYDDKKSEQNYTEHGMGFDTAQSLWDDPDLLEIPAKNSDEPRYVVIGILNQKHWSAVITYRSKTYE